MPVELLKACSTTASMVGTAVNTLPSPSLWPRCTQLPQQTAAPLNPFIQQTYMHVRQASFGLPPRLMRSWMPCAAPGLRVDPAQACAGWPLLPALLPSAAILAAWAALWQSAAPSSPPLRTAPDSQTGTTISTASAGTVELSGAKTTAACWVQGPHGRAHVEGSLEAWSMSCSAAMSYGEGLE